MKKIKTNLKTVPKLEIERICMSLCWEACWRVSKGYLFENIFEKKNDYYAHY